MRDKAASSLGTTRMGGHAGSPRGAYFIWDRTCSDGLSKQILAEFVGSIHGVGQRFEPTELKA